MAAVRPRNLIACVALIVAAMLSLGLVSKARAAEPGVVPDLTWYVSDADKQRTAAALEDIGSKWVRLHVNWYEAEPSKGSYNEWWMNEYGKAIDVAHAAGQRVILMVSEAPSWASGSSSKNVPSDPADYADFMSHLASRFQGKVDAYEVWNEPNLKRFWSTGPDPSEYAALLKAAYPAIKAADSSAKVVFGGLSTNDYDFLEGAYKAGVKGSFDVMGTHPYTYCGSTGPDDVRYSNGRISRDSFLGYRELRTTMAAHNDAKPIWFTEFGWNTSSTKCDPGSGVWQGGVSESKQADYLTRALKLIEADPYVQVALWYDFRNNYWMNDADEPEARYGLLNTDFSPKPAYQAFKAYATTGGSGSTDTSGTGSTDTSGSGKTDTKTKIKVHGKRRRARVRGRVLGADSGRVKVKIQKRRHGKWRRVAKRAVKVRASGRYKVRVQHLPQGRMRARAKYRGTPKHSRSRSKKVRFRLR